MSKMKDKLQDINEQKLQEMADKIDEQVKEDYMLGEVMEQAVKDYENRLRLSFNYGLIIGTIITAIGLTLAGVLT